MPAPLLRGVGDDSCKLVQNARTIIVMSAMAVTISVAVALAFLLILLFGFGFDFALLLRLGFYFVPVAIFVAISGLVAVTISILVAIPISIAISLSVAILISVAIPVPIAIAVTISVTVASFHGMVAAGAVRKKTRRTNGGSAHSQNHDPDKLPQFPLHSTNSFYSIGIWAILFGRFRKEMPGLGGMLALNKKLASRC